MVLSCVLTARLNRYRVDSTGYFSPVSISSKLSQEPPNPVFKFNKRIGWEANQTLGSVWRVFSSPDLTQLALPNVSYGCKYFTRL